MKELLKLQNIYVEIKDHTIFENVNTNVQQRGYYWNHW